MPLGCFNLHASLLPRWRGAAPINRAIMAGDAETGVTIMKMDEGLDTGPMAMAERAAIGPDMTAGELHDALGAARRRSDAARARRRWSAARLQLTPQPRTGVTYADKIDKDETRIDWRKPWRAVHDHIRGLSPFPGAWFDMPAARTREGAAHDEGLRGAGRPARCWMIGSRSPAATEPCASCELQRAGKQPMQADEFLRGASIAPGNAARLNHAPLQASHRI